MKLVKAVKSIQQKEIGQHPQGSNKPAQNIYFKIFLKSINKNLTF